MAALLKFVSQQREEKLLEEDELLYVVRGSCAHAFGRLWSRPSQRQRLSLLHRRHAGLCSAG